MSWFQSKQARAASAAEVAALQELRDLIRDVTVDRPAWTCVVCAVKDGHRHGCPQADVPPPRMVTAREEFEADEGDEPEDPTIVAYLPLDWRAQVGAVITDPADRERALALLDEWDAPLALDPGDAMLEGASDAYSIHSAYLWARASVTDSPAARAALIKAGVDAEENAHAYRKMQKRYRTPITSASISPARTTMTAWAQANPNQQ